MPEPATTVSFPITLRHEHRLLFTRDVFAVENLVLAGLLTPRESGENVRALVFWDAGLAAAFPELAEKITHWFANHCEQVRLAAPPIMVAGGEPAKNDFGQLEKIWSAINAAGLCRHSYIVAVGGGAMLDMVGFAASRSCACRPRASARPTAGLG